MLKYCIVIPRVNGMDEGLIMNSFSDGSNLRLSKHGNSIVTGILMAWVPLSIVTVFSLLTLMRGPGN